jgi:hypothetical protein
VCQSNDSRLKNNEEEHERDMRKNIEKSLDDMETVIDTAWRKMRLFDYLSGDDIIELEGTAFQALSNMQQCYSQTEIVVRFGSSNLSDEIDQRFYVRTDLLHL